MAGKERDPHDDDRRSLKDEVAYARLIAELTDMQAWWDRDKRKPGVIPRGGAGAAEAPGPRPRTKLTVKFGAEVVKWFRAMGLGYQARMNHVLRSWMLSVIVEELAADGARTR